MTLLVYYRYLPHSLNNHSILFWVILKENDAGKVSGNGKGAGDTSRDGKNNRKMKDFPNVKERKKKKRLRYF